ncbi:MAG: glycosyl transferase [Candidatus Methylomirabilales bacterium]
MADFHQGGVITTLHRLGPSNLEQLERELEDSRLTKPIALVLPCLHSELHGEALPRIVAELEKVRYLREVVVALGRASRQEFVHAQSFFGHLPQEIHILWLDGPGMQGLFRELEKAGIVTGPDGKGKAAWVAYGYVLAHDESEVVVLHDCDVLTYSRELLVRLCYPVANPKLDFEYCKGYYPRVTHKLHGRATRLFVTPLLRALERVVGPHPFLTYLDSFRYPLAGEFAMIADLARVNRIPGDWGLEVGMLAEIYRNCTVNRICQADLADAYDHKHQPLKRDDSEAGLMRMAIDIAKSIFRTLTEEGVVMSPNLLNSLSVTYLRTAKEMTSRYQNDALINSLDFDQHEEGSAVEAFAHAMRVASDQYLADPLGTILIPNWNRVVSAIPDIFDQLLTVVADDNG